MDCFYAGLTPLCPAGHLPHKGGDRKSAELWRRPSRLWQGACAQPISLLVGEMPGRAEGGSHRVRHQSCFPANLSVARIS
ncbi:hypothetical protein GFL88_19115 [Rhizobium leguminosarum bv. viciae]|nr:hypothetical protein [Rhizobium leguminosarum bv. viciae]